MKSTVAKLRRRIKRIEALRARILAVLSPKASG